MVTSPTTEWKPGDRRSFTHTFTSAEVESFARLTGDMNPLHLDSEFARTTLLDEPVVHGMLAAAFVSTLVGMHIPGPGALWNSFQIVWRKPIRIGDEIRFEVEVLRVTASTQSLDLKIHGVHEQTRAAHLEGTASVQAVERTQPPTKDQTETRRVVITGATGAAGQAICLALAKAGFELLLLGRSSERLHDLARRLGPLCRGQWPVDLRDDKAVDHALKKVSLHGPIYGLVHTAAPRLQFLPVDDPRNVEQMREHWLVSVEALQRISLALLPMMTGGGSILTILTQAVLDAPPAKMSAYVAAKHAAWGLIKSMALELGPRGIRCNAVSPGMINSSYSSDVPLRIKQVEAAMNPRRRLCQVEDVAAAAAFLMSAEAEFINGVNLPVVGGARMP